MLSINEWLGNQTRKEFPELRVKLHCPYGSWQTSRYLQILTPMTDDWNVHYEYLIGCGPNGERYGKLELHFEGEDWETKYGTIIEEIRNCTQWNEELVWSEWNLGYRCWFQKKINTWEDFARILPLFMETLDKAIKESTDTQIHREVFDLETKDILCQQEANIEIYTHNLEEILCLPLAIPNYQRIYCWDEANVRCLLDDIFEHFEGQDKQNTPYRLGTIILHAHHRKYDIIDGQQRLVTLSLLLNELGVHPKLLDEEFFTKRSIDYVAYNKYLINNYVQRNVRKTQSLSQKFLKMLEFSVLLLKDASLDLAYTFFSNQNSRGVELTDYDLLKAHHLRYIPQTYEQQSMRVAQVWNKMIEDGRVQAEENEMPDYARTLDTYLYRLRKWMRKRDYLEGNGNYRVKKEFEAAPIIDEIPPFGEKFYFNEPIQGGTHFFSFVEQHLDKYHQFISTDEFKCLHHGVTGGSHQWYRDVIESILFGYYLKFGIFYLPDALVVIMRIILQHRYTHGRAQRGAIIQYVGSKELIMMIDQATSPTFFLAEAKNIAKELAYPFRKDMSPIQLDMRRKAINISNHLENNIVSDYFKNLNR